MKGLVIRTTGSWYKVLSQQESSMVDCRLRGNYRLRGNKQTNPIAVGDTVEFSLQEDGTGLITEVADRTNYIIRKATKLSKQTHVIAANIDQLCIVATLGFPRTSTGFIDRLLVTAEAYHIPACILFNKIDLYGNRASAEGAEMWSIHDELAGMYGRVGYPVYAVSALTGEGVEEIRRLIAGKKTLFTGHSGVGKSALLNAIDPSLRLKVGDVSEWSMKGKHTTTFAEIFPIHLSPSTSQDSELNQNSFLIDTPGIKEFGMVDIQPEELSHFFPEMRAVLHDCQFHNCTHTHEPHCAVKQAVEEGCVAEERYQNYLGILDQIRNGE